MQLIPPRLAFLIVPLCALSAAGRAAETPKPGRVTTVAGFGFMGRSNVDINLVSPGLMSIDDEGGVYFPDTGNHVVYNRDPWNILDPLAGTGLPGFSGDGGPAGEARLNGPRGVAARGASRVYDPSQNPDIDPNRAVGNVYIADTGNHRIRKVFRGDGGRDLIVTIAGDGTPFYKGDGGSALQAGFASPEGVAVDKAGAVYVADRLDHRVRKIGTDGTISTYAGTGVAGYNGDGIPAAQAQLNEPTDLTFDGDDNLYISDHANDRVRKVTPDGAISTYIGGGTHVEDGWPGTETAIDRPNGIARSPEGGFYFTDGLRVRAYMNGPSTLSDAAVQDYSSLVDHLRDGGNPLSAYLVSQFSDAFKATLANYDTSAFPTETFKAAIQSELNRAILGPNLYDPTRFAGVNLSQEAKDTIAANPQGEGLVRLNRRLLDEAYPEDLYPNEMDGKVHTYAGNGQEGWSGGDAVSPVEVSFRRPYGLAVPSQERLLITDDLQRRIRGVNGFGGDTNYILTPLGKNVWDDYPARSAKLTLPLAVAPQADGQALIADYGNRRIRSITPPCDEAQPREPYYLYTVAGKGLPRSGATDPPCSNLYPSDYAPAAEGVKAVDADLQPTGVAGTVGGPYYLSEGERGRVWKVDASGLLHAVNVPGMVHPLGLALAADGRLFVADRDASRVWVVGSDGAAAPFAGSDTGAEAESGPATQVKLKRPEAVAVAPDGSVYIADTGAHGIRRVKDGMLTTVAGTGAPGYSAGGPVSVAPLNAPRGVAVDADGTLYIADSGNNRIVRLNGGALEAVSGGPDPGLPESDPLTGADTDEWAGSSLWNGPAGMAFDGNGNLYVADSNNHRVRVLWNAAAARFGADPAIGPGDVNEDGTLDINDVILTLQVTVDLVKVSDRRERIADVSPPGAPPGDGTLDVSDAIRIIRRIVGLIPDGEWP